MVQLNTNGSADLGLMQVNSIWIRPLARMARLTENVVVDRLIDDPCFNINAAAAIMQLYMAEARGDLMVAIGYYHSHTPMLSSAYQQKVLAAASVLFHRERRYSR